MNKIVLIIIIIIILGAAFVYFNKKSLYSPDEDTRKYRACSSDDRCVLYPDARGGTPNYCNTDADCKKTIHIRRLCAIPIISLLCIN